jgi:hypothetical protein
MSYLSRRLREERQAELTRQIEKRLELVVLDPDLANRVNKLVSRVQLERLTNED